MAAFGLAGPIQPGCRLARPRRLGPSFRAAAAECSKRPLAPFVCRPCAEKPRRRPHPRRPHPRRPYPCPNLLLSAAADAPGRHPSSYISLFGPARASRCRSPLGGAPARPGLASGGDATTGDVISPSGVAPASSGALRTRALGSARPCGLGPALLLRRGGVKPTRREGWLPAGGLLRLRLRLAGQGRSALELRF